MAWKNKSSAPAKLGTASSKINSSLDNDDFQTSDDANQIRRYAALRTNKPRHTKAMNRIKSENSAISDLSGDGDNGTDQTTQPRVLARAGRKVMSRNMSRA